MKKYDITASLLIIITCVLVVIFLSLRSIDGGGTAPSYRFLGGQKPMVCKKADSPDDNIRYTYSFEADFNDLCSKADAELIPAGFVGSTLVDEPFFGNKGRIYFQKERFPRGPVWVYIYDNVQCIKHTNSNNFGIAPKDGWIWVEVAYWRGWRWPF
jgi:hypothetical protein